MTMLDLEALDVLRDVMEDEYESLVHLYVRDSDGRFSQMRDAAAAGNAEHLRHIVHSFKGASGNICAPSLAARAQSLEDAARAGASEALLDEISLLEQDYLQVREALIATLS